MLFSVLNSSQNHPETASLIPLKDNLIFKLPLDKASKWLPT
jgi:hypothetical protein